MEQPVPDTPNHDLPTTGLDSTTTLLLRVKQGDAAARESLLARFLGPLRRWARGRMPRSASNLADTDDLVQITLLRALDHLEAFEPRREGAFLAYLRRILMNQIRDAARKTSRSPRREALDEDLPDSEPSPLEQTAGKETVARYELALSKLSEDEQQAVVLRLELGFSYPEIARATGASSPNAARMKVVRAVQRIAEELS
jgi:RNA polymerase sigma-70 factor (ECF subfamily)